MEEHCGQWKGGRNKCRGKRVEAGVIASREPLRALVESSNKEEMKDDRVNLQDLLSHIDQPYRGQWPLGTVQFMHWLYMSWVLKYGRVKC